METWQFIVALSTGIGIAIAALFSINARIDGLHKRIDELYVRIEKINGEIMGAQKYLSERIDRLYDVFAKK